MTKAAFWLFQMLVGLLFGLQEARHARLDLVGGITKSSMSAVAALAPAPAIRSVNENMYLYGV